MSDDADVAEEKALVMEMNQLISKAVVSAVPADGEQEAKKYLVYYVSPKEGRKLYLVTDDDYVADSAKRHIGMYYGLRDNVSVEEVEHDAAADEMPKYESSDALYQDLWW